MEKVFLSYTYQPHPDYTEALDKLRRCVVRVMEAMGLRVIDGADVGGRPLDDALRKLIDDSDALIALVTPQSNNQGELVSPEFVLSEFHYANSQKPTMRVLDQHLNPKGLGDNNEYVLYVPGKELDIVLKLLNTIAIWKRELGQTARIRIEPEELAARYDEKNGDRCEYQLISQFGEYQEFERVRLRLDPGAAYALLPRMREGVRVRLRLEQGNKTWQSKYAIDPFIGGVRLEEKQ